MSFRSNRSWVYFLLVAVVLGLLAVLAAFQYSWLGQISDAERARLRSRLKTDTKRFSEDFNGEVRRAYFSFQMDAETFKEKRWRDLEKRYRFWSANTEYPEFIKDISFFAAAEESELLRFDEDKGDLRLISWTAELQSLKKRLLSDDHFEPVEESVPALVIPVYEKHEDVQHLVLKAKKELQSGKTPGEQEFVYPKKFGFLLLRLDREVITKKLLPDLAKKYFSSGEAAGYRLAVYDRSNRAVFNTNGALPTSADSSVWFFDVEPKNLAFFAERSANVPAETSGTRSRLVVSEKFETKVVTEATGTDRRSLDVNVLSGDNPRVTVFERKGKPPTGVWRLAVQHSQGSLDQFVANTRFRNLAISFGILAILASSMILIFISSQRARDLARRQLDFVSSVSHEFRTPLAVIYSAGENLSDGVVSDDRKIADYGVLIKREGLKLTTMVEQILEYAGARSGKRKYRREEVDIARVVENAIEECAPLIEEEGFLLEKDVPNGLPHILGDESALEQAVRNLVSNSIKYSNGDRWLRVSVRNGGGHIGIEVEDRGIGISQRDQKRIFEPFFRARAVTDEQISGNGLGLSLVKDIVEAHDGTVRVESREGGGSLFTIELACISGN